MHAIFVDEEKSVGATTTFLRDRVIEQRERGERKKIDCHRVLLCFSETVSRRRSFNCCELRRGKVERSFGQPDTCINSAEFSRTLILWVEGGSRLKVETN